MNEEIEVKLKDLETTVEYSKVVVPKGMRSTYWRYFGFPADDNNQIVTKHKVLCVLCSTAIVYNKNTTNLRTHLVAKHADEFIAITQEKRGEIYTDKSRNNFGSPNKKIKIDPEVNVKTENSPDKLDPEIATDLDNQDNQFTEEDTIQNYEYETMVDDTSNLNHINAEVQQYNVNDLIQKMLISDLLPPFVLKGDGFKNFVRCMGGDFDESKRSEVKHNIAMMYQENFNKKIGTIEQKTSSLSYSISIEFFENLSHRENSTYINVSFIFLDITKITLENIFYKSFVIHDFTDWDEIFFGIDLKNCVAVIVNQNNASLEQYIRANVTNAQIVVCLDAILQNCIRRVFHLPEVQEIFDEALKIYEKVIADYETELNLGMDKICIWNKIYLLQRFTDTVSLKNDGKNIMYKIDEILNCLNPLKITMETIGDESIPSCTLIQPLISKLVDFNYCIEECDSEMTKQIKLVICKELTENVVNNAFLTEAAFMDPRFQHYIDPEAIKMVKSNLILKYDLQTEVKRDDETKNDQNNKLNIHNSKCLRKSSLKMFFNQAEDKTKLVFSQKNALETELIKYDAEGNLDLEECPITWWLEVGCSFRNLNKIAQNYFTIPCSVNNLFKKTIEERIDIYNRRQNLPNKYLNQLWFLYINNIETEFEKL